VTAERSVFTIGHSTHQQDRLIALLRQHDITAVCDVRSTPYSRLNPQFNREQLAQALRSCGISYLYLGKELGARSDDPACYEAGKVQYGRLAETSLFKQGIARVLAGMANGFRIALMCSEKEPLECHRTILVARNLGALGINIVHIHADGRLEGHDAALTRLIRLLRLPESDLFRSPEEIIADAYRKQEGRIAYETDQGPGEAIVKSTGE
jgi:uncharacterized protein (DUF488 family)